MPDAHVLIADDDRNLASTLAWVLKEHGYQVTVTNDAAQVIPLMRERAPDAVLLDIGFADADGTDVLERIKLDDRWRDLPVLMMSSLPLEDVAVRTLGLGAADYIRKPFRVRELLARIQAQLRMRAILRSARESLRETREALQRAQGESEHRRQLMDILQDVSAGLSGPETYHLMARRIAQALELSQCSVVLARTGTVPRVAATAYETGTRQDFVLDMGKYPELQAALETGRPVLVEDVSTSPLYREVRADWTRRGTKLATRSVIAIPFALQPDEAGVVFLRRAHGMPPLSPGDAEFADAVIRTAVVAVQRTMQMELALAEKRRLEQLAQTDPLTKALNRRALVERLGAEMERVRRYSTTLSLLLIDVDHFKAINDTHGHLTGDAVLVEMAALVRHMVRAVDMVARYGGEEFVIVLPETGASGAEVFAERVRELVEGHAFAVPGGTSIRVTTSIGVATYPGFGVESVEDLVAAADQALYRAKAEGRNRVRV